MTTVRYLTAETVKRFRAAPQTTFLKPLSRNSVSCPDVVVNYGGPDLTGHSDVVLSSPCEEGRDVLPGKARIGGCPRCTWYITVCYGPGHLRNKDINPAIR